MNNGVPQGAMGHFHAASFFGAARVSPMEERLANLEGKIQKLLYSQEQTYGAVVGAQQTLTMAYQGANT